MHHFRVFGHFEKPLFIELCKHIETKFLPANTVLSSEGVVCTLNRKTSVIISLPQSNSKKAINHDPFCKRNSQS